MSLETAKKEEKRFYLGSIMSYFLESDILIDWILISEKVKDNDELSEDSILRRRIMEETLISFGML